MDLSLFEKKIFSQNGEDGVTMKLIELIYDNNNKNKFYVEFGVYDGKECNTQILKENYNWDGLQIDRGKEFITKENIVELFRKYNVPQNINILSVDIDFNDFYCLKEILDNYQCDIIICEYNATHLADEDKIIIYEKYGGWDGTNYFGASLLSLDKLGKKYNYSLIYCNNNGVNCFFIHNDILKNKNLQIKNIGDIASIYKPAKYGNGPNGGHKQDPYNRQFISFNKAIDVIVTKNVPHEVINNTNTYNTKYGLITLYKNEYFIGNEFKNGKYWDIDTLLKLQIYISPNRNILEIGGHCGTSSIVYSSFLNNKQKIYVYEPQQNIYKLLVQNINQNNLQNKIIPYNLGVFCYEGNGQMNNTDLDGGYGVVLKRYNEENNLGCNFGGIGLGDDGENIKLTTIDNMKLDNIGFIHCDAQGSENFIFSKGIETIKKYRPVILYENNELYGKYLYDNVCKSYPNYNKESKFDIKKYCMEQLNYSHFIDRFNRSIDILLIP
jgi:FkbM family methyltransferase